MSFSLNKQFIVCPPHRRNSWLRPVMMGRGKFQEERKKTLWDDYWIRGMEGKVVNFRLIPLFKSVVNLLQTR